jgi:hypothetical protein
VITARWYQILPAQIFGFVFDNAQRLAFQGHPNSLPLKRVVIYEGDGPGHTKNL